MFCHVPFTDLHIDLNGDIHCCCPGWLPTILGNLFKSTIDEIRSGLIAEEIRRSVSDGDFRFCTNCAYLPNMQGPISESPPPWFLEKMASKNIHMLLLDYDLSCNLACPSCRTGMISSPSDTTIKIHEIVLSSGLLLKTDHILLSGSCDPFASKLYWQLLRDLPTINPLLYVHILTNGLLLDESRWTALGATQDRILGITISVDAATPETYKLNRGGSWDRLWRNIGFLRQLRRNGQQFRLSLNYVVQDNNFRELILLPQLVSDYEIDQVNVYFLSNWGTYSASDYQNRAVHLTSHEHHAEFVSVMENELLSANRKFVLPTFAR